MNYASLAFQNVQADMNLRWAHLSNGTFSDVAAQIFGSHISWVVFDLILKSSDTVSYFHIKVLA